MCVCVWGGEGCLCRKAYFYYTLKKKHFLSKILSELELSAGYEGIQIKEVTGVKPVCSWKRDLKVSSEPFYHGYLF